MITDPSYAGQVIAFTYPHIGNYGINAADDEAGRPFCRGVVVRDLTVRPSNWRSVEGFEQFLVRHGVPAVTGIDTRRLTRHLRDAGRHALRLRHGAAEAVAGGRPPRRPSRHRRPRPGGRGHHGRSPTCGATGPLRVVAYDFGVKETMLRHLAALATVTVVPASTPADEVLAARARRGVPLQRARATRPPCPARSATVADLLGRVPVFGICLGHQLLATALGGPTYKLPFGHHGGNHPVQRLADRPGGDHQPEPQLRRGGGRRPGPTCTHVNLNDGVVEGIAPPGGAGLQGPVPPRGRARPPRRPLPVRRVRGPRWRAAECRAAHDIESILVIGSGPIVIGQACEFDYSGTQACRVLAEEGYRVVLANSNPATIMTDPATADRTYVEPLDADVLAAIIERERPDALLPTLGRPDRPQPDHGAARAGVRWTSGWRSSGPGPRPSARPRTATCSSRP